MNIITIEKMTRFVSGKLRGANIAGYQREAQLLVCHGLGINSLELVSRSQQDVGTNEAACIEVLVSRRLDGEPVGRIIGSKEIYGLTFEYFTQTLEPRDDTEALIDAVLRDTKSIDDKKLSILELGTGSGVITVSLLKHLLNANAVATDISKEALKSARANSVRHDVDERLLIVNTHWCSGIRGKFDIIVSNPPYIRSDVIFTLSREVREYDPLLALDGGRDGLDAYRDIFSQCKEKLSDNGRLYLEIGYDQSSSICDLGREYGWRKLEIINDLNGNARVAIFELPKVPA